MERWCNEADIKWAVERELKKGTQVRNEEMCRERSAAAFGPAAGAGSGQRPGSAEPVPRPRGPPTRCGGLFGLPWRFRPQRGLPRAVRVRGARSGPAELPVPALYVRVWDPCVRLLAFVRAPSRRAVRSRPAGKFPSCSNSRGWGAEKLAALNNSEG